MLGHQLSRTHRIGVGDGIRAHLGEVSFSICASLKSQTISEILFDHKSDLISGGSSVVPKARTH